MSILSAGKHLGQTFKNAARLRTIVSVFAKHGFHNIAERIKLGRFLLERLNPADDLARYTVAERVRMSFEELGPTFIKLGQLLAGRPDLIPNNFVEEFAKLHDNVLKLPFPMIEEVLKSEFGERLYEIFESFDPEPIGAASIAQVHRARLRDNTDVVVKIQRPGVIQTINDDISVLYFLSDLLETYVPEVKMINPTTIIDEYYRTLQLETNFVVEANNIRRMTENFSKEEDIYIPKIYLNYTTEKVLVLEALPGLPLSSKSALSQDGVVATDVIRKCLKAYFKMVFIDGFFHGDLHAGNVFILPNGKIGLIDFGVVGRLSRQAQSSIVSMLLALSKEDYERVAFEYVDIAPFDERTDVDVFARDLRELMSPFFGLTLSQVNLGKILMTSASVASKNHISVPAELMLFFKSIISVESLGKRIYRDFDFLKYSLEFTSEIIRHQYEPSKLMSEISLVARESRGLLRQLPRQINFALRRINSPNHATRVRIKELEEIKRSIELSFNLLFLGLIIGSLLLSASVISLKSDVTHIAGLPALGVIGYTLAAVLSIVAFFNYIKK